MRDFGVLVKFDLIAYVPKLDYKHKPVFKEDQLPPLVEEQFPSYLYLAFHYYLVHIDLGLAAGIKPLGGHKVWLQ